jgi:hypothetical protein
MVFLSMANSIELPKQDSSPGFGGFSCSAVTAHHLH